MGDKRDVPLPARFHKYLKPTHSFNTHLSPVKTMSVSKSTSRPGDHRNIQIKQKDQRDITGEVRHTGSNMPCSEDDICQSLIWIQEQIRVMKEEDNVLMQQFLDLRARIRKLRSQMYSPTDVERDPTKYYQDISVSEPNIHIISLSESDTDPDLVDLGLSPHHSEDYLGEFRDRTVSMVPPKTGVTKVRTIRKYKTEGFL